MSDCISGPHWSDDPLMHSDFSAFASADDLLPLCGDLFGAGDMRAEQTLLDFDTRSDAAMERDEDTTSSTFNEDDFDGNRSLHASAYYCAHPGGVDCVDDDVAYARDDLEYNHYMMPPSAKRSLDDCFVLQHHEACECPQCKPYVQYVFHDVVPIASMTSDETAEVDSVQSANSTPNSTTTSTLAAHGSQETANVVRKYGMTSPREQAANVARCKKKKRKRNNNTPNYYNGARYRRGRQKKMSASRKTAQCESILATEAAATISPPPVDLAPSHSPLHLVSHPTSPAPSIAPDSPAPPTPLTPAVATSDTIVVPMGTIEAATPTRPRTVKSPVIQHEGIWFPPPYRPHGKPLLYFGRRVYMSPEAEEAAMLFFKSHGAKDKVFMRNFMSDFKLLMGDYPCPFDDIRLCDPGQLVIKLPAMRCSMFKPNKEIQTRFGFATVNGLRYPVRNFAMDVTRIVSAGPLRGRVRRRILPSDVTINITDPKSSLLSLGVSDSDNSTIHPWKAVVNQPDVEWTAWWRDPLNGSLEWSSVETIHIPLIPYNAPFVSAAAAPPSTTKEDNVLDVKIEHARVSPVRSLASSSSSLSLSQSTVEPTNFPYGSIQTLRHYFDWIASHEFKQGVDAMRNHRRALLEEFTRDFRAPKALLEPTNFPMPSEESLRAIQLCLAAWMVDALGFGIFKSNSSTSSSGGVYCANNGDAFSCLDLSASNVVFEPCGKVIAFKVDKIDDWKCANRVASNVVLDDETIYRSLFILRHIVSRRPSTLKAGVASGSARSSRLMFHLISEDNLASYMMSFFADDVFSHTTRQHRPDIVEFSMRTFNRNELMSQMLSTYNPEGKNSFDHVHHMCSAIHYCMTQFDTFAPCSSRHINPKPIADLVAEARRRLKSVQMRFKRLHDRAFDEEAMATGNASSSSSPYYSTSLHSTPDPTSDEYFHIGRMMDINSVLIEFWQARTHLLNLETINLNHAWLALDHRLLLSFASKHDIDASFMHNIITSPVLEKQKKVKIPKRVIFSL